MMKNETPRSVINRLTVAFLVCMALEGAAALAVSLRSPSEAGSAALFGLSPARLGVSALIAGAITALCGMAVVECTQVGWWRRFTYACRRWVHSPTWGLAILWTIFSLVLIFIALLVLYWSPAVVELSLFSALFNRVGLLLGWGALCLLQLGLWFLLTLHGDDRAHWLSWTPLRAGILLFSATLIYTITLRVSLAATWDTRFRGLEAYIFLPVIMLLLWGGAQRFLSSRIGDEKVNPAMLLLFIAALAYTIYWHTAQWVQMETTTNVATWHLVAQSFLEGKLYLENPYTTHDMTLYAGHWYVPLPPLPALVVLPFIAIFRIENFNMARFAILCGVANVVVH